MFCARLQVVRTETMRLLYITLLLCALSITVHSAADYDKGLREVLGYLEENVLDACEGQSEAVQCAQRELQSIMQFPSLSLFFIKECNCFKCITNNLQRAAFDVYVTETVVRPCGWFKHNDPDTYDDLLTCMKDGFNNLKFDDSTFTPDIDPKDEWESMKQLAKDCEDGGQQGNDMVKCVDEKYVNERAKKGQAACASKEDRNLYNSLRALLKLHQN
ncbi:uncharacterized protein LOC110447868 isoform X2 [Mizuhopecten yessoensis]|uniref:Uncharacterized protein n=3 Tax=Mizuhopecten yessoensis TaxID=6573 RepID=A0A210QUG6_MIZYE|nr:uncharacterized protein LOC110447868 isoform X2 [Mizuhopecten yessoensis]OWF52393.1 hypothetical protein KP79_PYT18561 [Mizuhopecten yessoensis]